MLELLQEALDVWSLGLMAFELLTGQPALRMREGKEAVRLLLGFISLVYSLVHMRRQVGLGQSGLQSRKESFDRGTTCCAHLKHAVQLMDKIEGVNGKHLPWEGANLTPANRRRLGVFRESVVMLLSRDPAMRPSAEEFCDTCDRVLAGSTSVQV